jgi:hypothetical protein
MAHEDSNQLDRLWQEYGQFLSDWDDMTLARWMAQTLAQLSGRAWRNSHPLIGVYRLAAIEAGRRGLRVGRLAMVPHEYPAAPCCGAPVLPVLTRDILEQGLHCMHCGGKLAGLEDLDGSVQQDLQEWAEKYNAVHQVAHWTDEERKKSRNYNKAYNAAAEEAENLLIELRDTILPRMLDLYPAVVWEDHDECLDIRADDLITD